MSTLYELVALPPGCSKPNEKTLIARSPAHNPRRIFLSISDGERTNLADFADRFAGDHDQRAVALVALNDVPLFPEGNL